MPKLREAEVHTASLKPVAGDWQLDMAELLATVTSDTRVLVLNAPNNPTGWTLSRAEQAELLAHCRRTDTWLLAVEMCE